MDPGEDTGSQTVSCVAEWDEGPQWLPGFVRKERVRK
jgi:hypothetical protein